MARSSWGSRGVVANRNRIHMTTHAARVLKGYQATPYDIELEPIPCRQLKDMSPEERAALEEQYGCPIAGRWSVGR